MITTLRPCSTCNAMKLTPWTEGRRTRNLEVSASRTTSWTTAPSLTIDELAAAIDVAVGMWLRSATGGEVTPLRVETVTTGQPYAHADKLCGFRPDNGYGS